MSTDNIGFVYKCLGCGYAYIKAAGMPLRCPQCDSKEREHTHTVDCMGVLERILNKQQCEVLEFFTEEEKNTL